MDIRSAKKPLLASTPNDKPLGTVPPRMVAGEKEKAPIADVDKDGEITLDDFDGDVVVAEYMDYLKKNGITEEDITNIQEALLTSNNVAWSFDLFDRIPVSFQIRPAWVDDYIIEYVDELTNDKGRVSNIRFNNIVAECNLAASLTQYGDDKFEIKSRSDLDNACERVKQYPYVIQNALVKKLAVFDRTIAVATSDWAIKNFTKPQQEK